MGKTPGLSTPVSPQPSFPRSPAQITPAFLTSILRSDEAFQRAAIASIEVEPLAARSAFNAQLARLHLTYEQLTTGAPHSLIVKMPTIKEELQQHAVVFQPGRKECWFYRRGVRRAPLNVPHCYYAEVDADTGESFLLLQDLAPARPGNRMAGASPEEAELALQALAQLHAAWWDFDPAEEPELANLVDNSEAAQHLVDQLYRRAWPRFLEQAAVEIPEDMRQFGEALPGRISAVEGLLAHSPQTLVHGDFRLDNMFFGSREGQPACWVIDWEDITLGNGMLDAAWFLGGCLPVEKVTEEQRLLHIYHQALLQAGVEGYSWEQCFRDYRVAMISSFVQGILMVASFDIRDEYARSLGGVLTQRFMLAFRRLRLADLLTSQKFNL